MSKQREITAFFGTRKRRAVDSISRDAKLFKGDPTLLKITKTSDSTKLLSHAYDGSLVEGNKDGGIDSSATDFTGQKPQENAQLNLDVVTSAVNPVAVQKADVALSTTARGQITQDKATSPSLKQSKSSFGEITQEKNVRGSLKPPTKELGPEKSGRGVELTPKKAGCDIRSYLTSRSPYRPECPKAVTPIKFFETTPVQRNELTPIKKTKPSIIKQKPKTSQDTSLVKKSIRFEDEVASVSDSNSSSSSAVAEEIREVVDTDDIIKAANDLVEKLKTKNRTLSTLDKDTSKAKQEVMTATQLKKKLARADKLAELKSSLSKLGHQASQLIKLEKKKKQVVEPKLTKFESIEIEVEKSPHKGALSSPVSSPVKSRPAFERFAHLIHRTAGPTAVLPLPFGFQRLVELFAATDTVCSMLLNRGEVITFRKLKPAVQELTRKNLTERHLGQMAAVLPSAFSFHQEKLRNFGSTSKLDRYELVVDPLLEKGSDNVRHVGQSEDGTDIVHAADRKKMTPKLMQARREAFQKALLERTLDKHEEFLASLDPPISVVRTQLTRWHPNFMVDLVPDVAPAILPEAPNEGKPASAKQVLERAKELLSSNERMRNALDAAARSSGVTSPPITPATIPAAPSLDEAAKKAIDKRVEAHNPLKGISKSLLEKIRAKQAAKALEVMKMSPADEKELLILSQLPDTACIVRTLFVDQGKGVLPFETLIEKVQFSGKRHLAKGDVDKLVRRLVSVLPDWLTIFSVKTVEYLKLQRAAPFAPILATLDAMIKQKRGY